jgi:hypothetical protein
MSSKNRPSIKDEGTYDALRREGYGKSKAARIANAQANENQSPSKKGGSQPPYEDWTKEELYERAKELDIEGRSEMSKDELIGALRD